MDRYRPFAPPCVGERSPAGEKNVRHSVRARFAALSLITAALAGCSSGPQTPAQRGKIVYMTNCVVCHNPNPNLPGSQGPAIAGSSGALIQARVLHLSYPPGYTPQRKTHGMRAFPQLAGEIGNLTAFLQAAKEQK
ncbi:MAG TPA: cytochrome c [Candidatus Binataceae bacterium]|jgi:mono/diheme cytochrome c family protein|nr:cytochrome c [Candidatus Binataceae bacterium]